MITITYDLNAILPALRDGEINKHVDLWQDLIKTCNDSEDIEMSIGNFLVLEEIRARVAENKIDCNKIQFKFAPTQEIIKINEKGRLSHWPDGFCDIFDKILDRILS